MLEVGGEVLGEHDPLAVLREGFPRLVVGGELLGSQCGEARGAGGLGHGDRGGTGSTVLLGAGVALGANYERVERFVGPVSTAVIVAVVLACVAGLVWLRRRSADGRTA
jgi:hypothetical protein